MAEKPRPTRTREELKALLQEIPWGATEMGVEEEAVEEPPPCGECGLPVDEGGTVFPSGWARCSACKAEWAARQHLLKGEKAHAVVAVTEIRCREDARASPGGTQALGIPGGVRRVAGGRQARLREGAGEVAVSELRVGVQSAGWASAVREIDGTLNRFLDKTERRDDGCLIWTGAITGKGYGTFDLDGRTVGAHRFAYATWVGPIPEGHLVHHDCETRACVEPSHLEALSAAEHNLIGTSPAAINWGKLYCVNGHLFDEANTAIDARGARRCRACGRERTRRNKQRKALVAA